MLAILKRSALSADTVVVMNIIRETASDFFGFLSNRIVLGIVALGTVPVCLLWLFSQGLQD